MFEKIKFIDINIRDKLVKAMKEWDKQVFLNDEDYNYNKNIITKQLEDGLDVKSEYLERMKSFYLLHFKLGERKLSFRENAQLGMTFLITTDEYGDKIKLLSNKGRPFKIKELFFERKNSTIEKNNQEEKICN
ncbi:MAG: hypothetical protein ACFFB4_15760, partial [Promethearchaeota archaeon]